MNPMGMAGGGGYQADFGATSTNKGGTNLVGGTVFGDYNPPNAATAASNMMPWIVVGVIALGAVFMLKGGK